MPFTHHKEKLRSEVLEKSMLPPANGNDNTFVFTLSSPLLGVIEIQNNLQKMLDK